MIVIMWIALWAGAFLGFVGVFAYLRWYSNALERTPVFPLHEWMEFALSLDPQRRDTVCQMIATGTYTYSWKEAFLAWYRVRARLSKSKGLRPVNLRPAPGVYVLAAHGHYKIGYSTDVQKRVGSLNTSSPVDLVPVYVFWTEQAQELEQKLHEKFAHQRVRREWFQLSPLDLAELDRLQARMT